MAYDLFSKDNRPRVSMVNVGTSDSDTVIEMLKPESLELFSDSKGREQPDRMQEEKVKAIMASAVDIGIVQPAIVRELADGRRQILSGRHRREAAIRLNRLLPCDVRRNISDVEAYKIMAETNSPRGEQYPSEQGQIYKAYMDMRGNVSEEDTAKTIAEKFNVSSKTIYRYINITRLPPILQRAVDLKIIPISKTEKMLSFTAEQLNTLAQYIDFYEINKVMGKHIEILADNADNDWDIEFIWNLLHNNDENNTSSSEEDKSHDSKFDSVFLTEIKKRFSALSDLQTDALTDYIMSLIERDMNSD